ncbi:MAG TPA: undecaprenyl-diphosphate phosphatase [Candidatus Saccharimonadales bacterium]|nr:undecaprenyl-diphosphate phosphatase [Candidatus Saccharimonadales bacterium]
MHYLLAILAGAVQGLTEFLPVSSTGHLIIFEHLFNISQDNFGLAFDASLHLGTLAAVLIFFFKDYLKVLNFKNGLMVKLIVGTIPAAILGLMFDNYIETTVRALWIVGAALIVFSPIMYFADSYGRKNLKENQVSLKQSFLIGLAQAIALIPGISRSGASMSAGLFLGLTREEAARFAFMLSGPIIAGAGTKKFLEVLLRSNLSHSDIMFFALGILSSAIFGYLTIKYFIKYISKNSLLPFIIYRVVLGALLILLSLH